MCWQNLIGDMLLSSWTRLSKSRAPQEQQSSPFPSPRTALLSSSIAARRRGVEGSQPPASDLDHDPTPGTNGKLDQDRQDRRGGQQQEWEGDDIPEEGPDEDMDGDMNEDGDDDVTPLLPIFSAAHLGTPSSGESAKCGQTG